jgi:hydrogenase nickel incorporation protein HypA/HybF
MHEWALAEAVVSAASNLADKEGLEKVTAINLKLGELQQVDIEIFKFAISQLASGKLKGIKVNIKKTRAMLKCRACDHQWPFSKACLDESEKEAIHFVPEIAHAYLRCPVCGSSDFEVEQGRGIWIESMKGEKRHG